MFVQKYKCDNIPHDNTIKTMMIKILKFKICHLLITFDCFQLPEFDLSFIIIFNHVFYSFRYINIKQLQKCQT